MENEKKLYPLKFCPIVESRLWGSEEFLLADLGYKDTFVRDGWLASNSLGELMDTYIDRIVGERVYDYYGRQFPLCLRRLKVQGRTPLQVSPDDETAQQRYDLLGKTKLWYVLRAGKDARLGVGFRRASDAGELFAKCADGSAEDLMNIIAPYEGQSIVIPAGTPHFAAGEIDILEVGESSPLDFCLCSWGQELSEDEFDPALDIADALDFICYDAFRSVPASGRTLAELPQMSVAKCALASPLVSRTDGSDNFVLYSCVSGSAAVQIDLFGQKLSYPCACGESVLIPAEWSEFALLPTSSDTLLLEILVDRTEADKYIDPNVPSEIL